VIRTPFHSFSFLFFLRSTRGGIVVRGHPAWWTARRRVLKFDMLGGRTLIERFADGRARDGHCQISLGISPVCS
jgi:hypothetical protein